MSERYSVRVTKDHLVFCSGHFITYQGDQCERLHGHNYRVAVEIEGPLDANYYVFDFVALKKLMKVATDEMDHFMLVAMKNPLLKVQADSEHVRIHYRNKEWILPREDCVLLDIENTTAELLARHLARRLVGIIKERSLPVPHIVSVEVEESFGQAATYHWNVPG